MYFLACGPLDGVTPTCKGVILTCLGLGIRPLWGIWCFGCILKQAHKVVETTLLADSL